MMDEFEEDCWFDP